MHADDDEKLTLSLTHTFKLSNALKFNKYNSIKTSSIEINHSNCVEEMNVYCISEWASVYPSEAIWVYFYYNSLYLFDRFLTDTLTDPQYHTYIRYLLFYGMQMWCRWCCFVFFVGLFISFPSFVSIAARRSHVHLNAVQLKLIIQHQWSTHIHR